MKRLLIGMCIVAAACVLGCRRFDLKLPGPTLMARVAEGYELSNRELRVVMDEKTGEVTYWGTADGKEDFLPGAVTAKLTSEPDAGSPDGYVEKRDDQTWQYIGVDGKKIRWRKIYCLEGRSVLVTYLVENMTTEPVTGRMAVRHGLENGGSGEAAAGSGAAGSWSLRAFTEKHDGEAAPAGELLSDSFRLKPTERASMTMEWKFIPRAAK